MGRRSRKRGVGDGLPAPAPEPRRDGFADRFIAADDERPKAPWHPFPLVELCVLVGIVLIVWGFIEFEERNGRILVAMGLVLASLAGLDTAVRDHFAGFRSHTLLLAGLPAVLTAGVLFFVRAPWPAIVVAALVILAAGIWFFRGQFRKRSGGIAFRA